MVGTLEPLDGMVKRHNHLRIGQYHQHLTELLPMDKSPLEYMVSGGQSGIQIQFKNAVTVSVHRDAVMLHELQEGPGWSSSGWGETEAGVKQDSGLQSPWPAIAPVV